MRFPFLVTFLILHHFIDLLQAYGCLFEIQWLSPYEYYLYESLGLLPENLWDWCEVCFYGLLSVDRSSGVKK